MRFIAVVHRWHVESKGFRVVELSAVTMEDAEKEAALEQVRNQDTCQSAAVRIIAIDGSERVVARRKLTWAERISGWSSAPGGVE